VGYRPTVDLQPAAAKAIAAMSAARSTLGVARVTITTPARECRDRGAEPRRSPYPTHPELHGTDHDDEIRT
jgi:hypothetical protein